MGNKKTILKVTNNFFERKEVFKYFYNDLENLNKNEKNYF